ncbi:pyridoxamine 5'-phosphate oxidase [Longibacter salinarum]|uniref:Pyridoxamine 5'-phosphate oxidase n=1 Tax=Longibacter salinarum TaxID=1850348 RepID=A0A2A8CV19_9BACT|nr:pyridoxamine 5'-phosphate oxidase [Longibacter salinarum]PEN12298.1 pyridoxamine 5'-phosphate oxidase [Longibacter salinarum]
MSIADLRQEYAKHELDQDHVEDDPIQQFEVWFDEALKAEVEEPNAMTLATTDELGRPAARIVLLKGADERGFIFYSNYDSQKGQQLTANPHAALVFWWEPLERQIRIEGEVEKLPDKESADYFKSRPYGSQLGAWASPQSRVIESREVLEKRLELVSAEYNEGEVPRPPHWGGYVVRPRTIEFWQGRPNRLHDRLRYRHEESGQWTLERLAP